MKLTKVILAAVFADIATRSQTTDDIAGSILTAIKQAKASTLEKFTDLVDEAYAANGWNRKVGRATAAAAENPETVAAPRAVKVYVSTIRAAYKLGVDVVKMEGIYQLREAVKEARRPAEELNKPVPAPLVGVHISADNRLTGATWHDALVIWGKLPRTTQKAFTVSLDRLAKRYGRTIAAKLERVA